MMRKKRSPRWGIIALALLGLLLMSSVAYAHEGDLTALQNAAGYVNLQNFIWLLSVIGIGGGICFVFRGVIATILGMESLMEALAWVMAIGLTVGSYFLPDSYQYLSAWTVPIGAIMFAIALYVSMALRNKMMKEINFSAILMIIWAAIALFYQSSFVGFIAVGALMSFIGFSIIVTPFCHAFGFDNDEAMARGTIAGILIATGYAVCDALGVNTGYIQVFETGALYLGTFVAGIGILIISCKWYKKESYLASNIFAVMIFIFGIGLSLLFGVRPISSMLIVFGLLYVTEKIIEIPVESSIAFGIHLIASGGFLFAAWKWISDNPNIVMQFQNLP